MGIESGPLRELSLFAGAGGGILAGKLLGWRCVCAVESDPYAAGVLAARQNEGHLAPPFPIWTDARTFRGEPWRGRVDVISAGWPCQNFSTAGKKEGLSGNESGLFSEVVRICREVRPQFLFLENSAAIVGSGDLATVLGEICQMGFDARWCVLGARHAVDRSGTQAPHRRDRWWALAYRNNEARQSPSSRERKDRGHQEGHHASRGVEEWRPGWEKETGKATAKRNDDGIWLCNQCGLDVFNGCTCYFGEWKCNDCGEWTYPFHYEIEDGCQHCGGSNVGDARGPRSPVGLPKEEAGSKGDSEKPLDGGDRRGGREAESWWAVEPQVGLLASRLASGVDVHGANDAGDVSRLVEGFRGRAEQLACIGNGQVPACAAMAWEILSRHLEN